MHKIVYNDGEAYLFGEYMHMDSNAHAIYICSAGKCENGGRQKDGVKGAEKSWLLYYLKMQNINILTVKYMG